MKRSYDRLQPDKPAADCRLYLSEPSRSASRPGRLTRKARIKRSAYGWLIPTRSLRSLPTHRMKAVAVSSRLFRSLSLAPQPPAHCAGLSPRPPGENKRPGASYQRDRQCPESAYINIIPSGLCNSSQDRHLSASRVSSRAGMYPAATVLQAAG